MPKIEKILLIIGAAAVFLGLSYAAAGPIYSDEMMYIDIALRNYQMPSYGNRIFHVYLQKLFLAIFPTPLMGIKVFWSFLMTATMVMAYLLARKITDKSTALHGILALVFFFSFPIFVEFSGEPAVDITAMAMVMAYITVYFAAVRDPSREKTAVFILGVLAFLCLKTKETTIFVHIMLLGLVVNQQKPWVDWKRVWDLAKRFLLGAAAGIGLMIVLDGLILGNPFFSISPATFGEIFTHYDYPSAFYNGPASWYEIYFLDELITPFMLFLMAGALWQGKMDLKRKLIWIFPMIYAAFVSLNMLIIPWGFIERFYFPALPVVAALAPQAIRFSWPKEKKEWIGFALSLAAIVGLVLVMRTVWIDFSRSIYFDYGRMLDSVYFPVLLSLLFGAVIFIKGERWYHALIQLFCVVSLMMTPVLTSYKYFVTYPRVQEKYDALFYPFETYREELKEFDRAFYYSTTIKRQEDMLSADPNDIIGMFNFFFDGRIERENIIMGYDQAEMPVALLTQDFSHALLTAHDVDYLRAQDALGEVQDTFEIISADPHGKIILLVRK